MGVWGQSPSGIQGQSPWSGGKEAKPPKAEALLAFGRSMKAPNLHNFLQFTNLKKSDICLILQKIMDGHETGGLEQNWGTVPIGSGLKLPLTSNTVI